MALPRETAAAKSILADIRRNGLRQVIDAMTHEECVRATLEFGTHNYHPLDVTIVEGKGAWVVDANGKRYIDCVGCYSALSLGHLPDSIPEMLHAQMDILTLTGRAVFTREMAVFLQALCEYCGMDMACPINTGVEAVETAIKLARKWAYTVKGVQHDKAEIIAANDNFHGRTTTVVGFSTEKQYREGFGPYAPGFKLVPFGDMAALRDAVTDNTAAVLMEPIQAEGGILMPPDGYMAQVRELCTRQKVLLVWDEVQTGFCRTGRRFAWQHEDAEPDMMCLGKALGAGVMPVSAVVGRREVMDVFQPGDHGSTFGVNPLSSVVATQALAEMAENRFEENARILGGHFMARLRTLNHPAVKEVRGRGLLVGLEIKEGFDGGLQQAFLDNGVLTKETRHRTFRFAPPVNCDRALIDEIVARVERSLR